MTDWAALLEPVALALLGEPPRRPASGEWRYRRKGSLAVHVGGPRRGIWRDHEADKGGGVLDLLAHLEGLDRAAALEWLGDRGLLDGPRRGQERAGGWQRGRGADTPVSPPVNRSTGRLGPVFPPAEGPERGKGVKVAERAWAQGLPIPADADHPARRWMARRHLWRPEIALPPSVRWLSADRWRWWDAAPDLAGAVVAAFAPPGTGRLSGVQLVHVDIEGRPVLDKPEAAGGLDKRSHGRMAGAVCVLGLPGQGGVNVAEGLADALPLAARLPWRAVCMGGTAGYHNAQLASWLAGLPHVGVWADLDEALQGLRAARVLASAIVGAGGYATVEHVGVGEDPGAAGAPFGTLGPEFATMAADLEREGLPAWEAARVAATILT